MMEVDAPSTSEQHDVPSLPVFSVNVLQTIRDAQSIHGLKHSDYQRYRQYCSRRLRRIYKGVKFLHGRGRYQKKKLEPENVKEERHIHIPLVQAERAWAHAMDLKHQVEQEMESQKRHHLIRRLSKAASHAADLVRLTGARCDARTQLEAEAYGSWMAGSMLLEKESDWEGALARFAKARRLFEELAKVGSYDQQTVCKHFLDQVEPTIRYCQYQISRRGGAAPDPSELLDLGAAGVGDQLQSKLASLAAQAQAQRAASTSEITWGGEQYPVRDERVRIALHAAQELEAELDAGMEVEGGGGEARADVDARVALFDRAVNAYGDARAAIRSALQLGGGGADSEAIRAELTSLDRAVQGLVLQLTIRRNLFLAEEAAARLARAQRRALAGQKAKGGERVAKPEDVVRLYESLTANASALNELAAEVGGALGEALMDDCSAKVAHYQAARCLYVAHSYLAAGKATEALALFQRAQERVAQAVARLEDCSRPDPSAAAQLEALGQQAAAFALVAAAELAAAEAQEREGVQAGVAEMSLEGAPAGRKRAAEDKFLAESLDEWQSFLVCAGKSSSARIARLPPAPSSVPVRPIVLDAALNHIQLPSLQHRLPAKQQAAAQGGLVGRLFGGWGTGR